jgi:TPR repeat protein/Zn-dependent protease with chaperone function
MTELSQPQTSIPRLNPFAFLSETSLRFVLLVIFALSGSVGLYGVAWDALHRQESRAADVCVATFSNILLRLQTTPGHTASEFAEIVRTEIQPQIGGCSKLLRPRAFWEIAGVLFGMVMTAALYFLLPALILKWYRLRPVMAADVPGLQEELQDVCGSIPLRNMPALVWNPLSVGMPFVFGTIGRYYVAYSGTSVVRLYTDRAAFRTIARHEMAHIRSGDINKVFFAIAATAAFFVTNLVPLLFLCIFADVRWSEIAGLLLQAVLWGSIIILSGASVLRVREYYADVQAAAWEGCISNVDRVLGLLSDSVRNGWRKYVSLHPAVAQRRQTVMDPSGLFPFGTWDAFAIGVAAWLAIDVLQGMIMGFLPADPLPFVLTFAFADLVLPILLLLLAVGAVGIGVWRGAFSAFVKRQDGSRGTGRLGLALGASSLVPVVLALLNAELSRSGQTQIPYGWILRTIAMNACIGAIVTIGCVLVFRWIADAVSAWLEVVLHSRSPTSILLLTTSVAMAIVIATMSAAFIGVYFVAVGGFRETEMPTIMVAQIIGPPVLFGSVLCWAFPLAAQFWQRNSEHRDWTAWVFLDRTEFHRASEPPWRPKHALVTGIVMGLGFSLLMEIFYFSAQGYFPGWASHGINSSFSWLKLWFGRNFGSGDGGVLIAAATLFQALAAAVASASARSLPTLTGLFAASVAGGVVIVFDLLFFAFGLNGGFEALIGVLGMLAYGAIIALPLSIVSPWVAASFTRIRRRDQFLQADVANPPARLAWARLGKCVAVCLCIAIVTGVVVRMRTVILAHQDVVALRDAAEGGDVGAQRRLGDMYASGKSVQRDDAQALYWIRRAAEVGDADSEYRLGVLYFRGQGVPHDDSLAAVWVFKAASQGYPAAEKDLGLLYSYGRGVPRDDQLAAGWFRRAAEHGNAEGQNYLGLSYNRGIGIPRDDSAAIEWFQKAADQGYAVAQNNLGMMYRLGLGAPRDDEAAVSFFRKAAEQGYAEAQDNLGQSHDQGVALPRDEILAAAWFQKAADQGYEPAVKHLQAMCERGFHPACAN